MCGVQIFSFLFPVKIFDCVSRDVLQEENSPAVPLVIEWIKKHSEYVMGVRNMICCNIKNEESFEMFCPHMKPGNET